MNSAVCSVVSYALNAAWQTPLLAAAGWLAARLLRRCGPREQHRAWVATLMASALAPGLPICRAVFHAAVLRYEGAAPGASFTAFYIGDTGGLAHAGVFLLPVWLIGGLFVLYTGSLLYFSTRLIWLLFAARRLVRGACPGVWTPATRVLWQRARQVFAPADAAVLISAGVNGVVTIGARRPSILLPAGWLSQSDEQEMLSALGHEMAHVLRHDYAKNLLYEIASIAVAFHPVTWIVKNQIVETREMTCDRLVVDRLMDTKAYRQSLLRLAQRMISTRPPAVHAVGIFDGNILEKRIMVMRTKRAILGTLARAGLAGCVAFLLAATIAGGTALARPVYASHQDEPWGAVYKIAGAVTAPVVIHSVEAQISDKARRAKYQGVCLISLVVDAQGNPQNIRVARALGMGLDKQAIEAIRQYKFKPAVKDGQTPVPVAITIEVDFRLY